MNDPAAPSKNLNHRWTDAFNAGDLRLLMTMYEPDAVVVPNPGAEPVQGHDAIEAVIRKFLAMGGQLRTTPRPWIIRGDIALSSMDYVMDGGHDEDGNPVDLRGITTEVARRQADGTWKYVIDQPFMSEG
ncbi:YybH family protein [Mycolicibacterium chlorophenolicum]|uniref:SnoaL-like domain protein n=1 Tax=Mycolicibacterium chlorophenolicum TaxID=37916 RepID=A0A0J6Y119_9MYCO|nr:nuclear transport factor 2 family protein [Mycolicibacterium chlorophenolicum]KMO66971.1 SnoaL-like domain protein [Mycolicibacterium chlorophenolicum]